MELPFFSSENTHVFELTDEEIEWFDHFFKSKEFAEALGIAWAYGSDFSHSFTVRCSKRSTVERLAGLVRKTRPVYSQTAYIQSDKNKPYDQWICGMHYMHPFVLKIKNMGWVPITREDRPYPLGDFDDEVFIKTYIKLHHSLDISHSKTINYTRPRLRIHGTEGVLSRINHFLFENLSVSKKKIQNHQISNKTKTLQYTSKLEIPEILDYVNAYDSLDKFKSLKIGYLNR